MAIPAPSKNIQSLSGLLPYMARYRGRIALAVLFLVLAAVSTLIFPLALKSLIDEGLVATDPGQRVMALRGHFFALFAVGAALGLFSANIISLPDANNPTQYRVILGYDYQPCFQPQDLSH